MEQRWQLSDLPPADRAEGWRDVVARTHLPWRVDGSTPESGRPFEARVRRRRYGDLDIVDCRCDPCSGGRERAEVRATDTERVAVLVILGGREILEQDGRCVELKAGDLALWDSTRPARFAVLAPLRKRTLLLPRDAVRGDGWAARRLPRAALAVGLLRSHLATLDRHPEAAERDAELAARIAAELVAGCAELAGEGRGERAVRPATAERRAGMRQAVELFIDRRLDLVERGVPLHPGELAPAAVAAAHAISARGLHQLFEDRAEPVTRRVRRLRLERARGQLRRGHGSVATVAARWGFTDPSHFARAYREEFGEAPRDTLLGSAGPVVSRGSGTTRWRG